MDLPAPLAWLVDEAGASSGPDRFLADIGDRLLASGLPLAGAALTLAVQHPIIARRTWMWRAETAAVIEALGFHADDPAQAGGSWLAGLGPVHRSTIGSASESVLGWAGTRPFSAADESTLRQVARFAAMPLAALAARAKLTSLLEAYLGQRSATRVEAGAFRRGTGETIRAVLLVADLRDFTAFSETAAPADVIATLDAWFDRVAAAIHAFEGEILKFIGDGVLAIFPVTGTPADACQRALRAVAAARAGMAHLDAERRTQGLSSLSFGAALHLGDIMWGNVGAAGRLDFTAIGPAVNLVSRLEGLCRPLGRSVLLSGAVAAQTSAALVPLGDHPLRGVTQPCAVFAMPDT